MALPGTAGHPFAVVFDLDEALIDNRAAWCYTVEESAAALGYGRVDARPLVDEYRTRPWTDALRIILRDPRDAIACADLCARMYTRSSMKRLLVHEGTGMALDRLRGEYIEMGAITRLPHSIALKQIHSTGLDRFLAVLSPTPTGHAWDPPERFLECAGYLGRTPAECAFVGVDAADLSGVGRAGAVAVEAGWATTEPTGYPVLTAPADLDGLRHHTTR